MSSNYPYGLDPNYAASYMPPDEPKIKEEGGGQGKDPPQPGDSQKVRDIIGEIQTLNN